MTTFGIVVSLISNLCLIVVVTYLLSRMRFFKEIINQDFSAAGRVIFLIVFGLLSIYGSYSQVELPSGAFINLRDLGPIAAGFLGGPLAGLGAGLVGGIYRLWEGGSTAVPSAISTVAIGLSSGIIYNVLRGRLIIPVGAALFAALGECFLMALILLLSRPFSEALTTVKISAFPMITANAIGAGLLVAIIRYIVRERQKEPSSFWDQIP
jgi:phosphoserine phosphatase RsbU/P